MMRAISFQCCVLLATFLPLQAQQTSAKNAVLANERAFSELQIQRKCDEAAQLLDDSERGISTGIGTKSDFVSSCKSDDAIPTRETFSNVEFTLLAPETALVTYMDDASFLVDGKPIALQAYVASLWVKHGSKWLLALHTATSVPFAVTDQGRIRLLYPDSDERHQDAEVSMRAQQPTTGQHDESTGQRELENQIVALEKHLWNGDDILKLEADDYEVIKHAHRYHRADDEAAAKEAKYALVSMDDIRVRMLRPDVALMTYHATEKGSFRGTDVPPSLYLGSIWVNRGGGWKNVFLEENLPDAFTETYMPGSGSKSGSVLQNASDKSATDATEEERLQINKSLLNVTSPNDHWTPPKTAVVATDLEWLVGDWRIEKHYYPNPFMPGKNLVETEQCAWAVGGYYIICNSQDILDKGKPVREIVVWSQDVEPHVLRFVDISPDDSTDQPTAGWCRIEGDMWYCYSEPRLENGKTIHLRFVTKNTPSSANGNSQFSEDGTKWLPLSDDSWTKVR